jgi:uncharacterized protein (DUF427 family)
MRPHRVEPGPGQESVWDYPRPPAVEACDHHVTVTISGITLADSQRPIRVLETSQPPAYYVPPADVRTDLLAPAADRTFCEWKGTASYWSVEIDGRTVENVAWSYPDPTERFAGIRDHFAFYPQRVDRCTVDGEEVEGNEGSFYGGWITSRVVGPFKGGPGTTGW